MSKYKKYDVITKEILDEIKVGDLVKVNDWKKPMRVKGVSENYFVMESKVFGKPLYSVCEKKPWVGIRYNAMIGGMFHIGTDHWIFGWSGFEGKYDFDNQDLTSRYLQSFETGESELSMRTSVPIRMLCVKSYEKENENER